MAGDGDLRAQISEVRAEVLPRLSVDCDLGEDKQRRPCVEASHVETLASNKAFLVGVTVSSESVAPGQTGQLHPEGFLDRAADA